jgi:hypothetical protein
MPQAQVASQHHVFAQKSWHVRRPKGKGTLPDSCIHLAAD